MVCCKKVTKFRLNHNSLSKGKQQISKEWTKQLNQMPLKNKTSSNLNELPHLLNTGLWYQSLKIIFGEENVKHKYILKSLHTVALHFAHLTERLNRPERLNTFEQQLEGD